MAETVENRVRTYRLAAKVTQGELAEAVQVSRQTIIAIEKGKYVPSVLLAMKLANYFKTSVEELFSIESYT